MIATFIISCTTICPSALLQHHWHMHWGRTPCFCSWHVAGRQTHLPLCAAGGPAMIRAAAKNHSHVAVVVDPNDYNELLQHLAGDVSSKEAVQYRKRLAWKAFQHCATYDSTVAEWLWSQIGDFVQFHCKSSAKSSYAMRCKRLISYYHTRSWNASCSAQAS